MPPVILQGDFGNLLPPTVQSFTGDDPDDGDSQFGASDVLLVEFDMATDRGKGDPFGGKAWVDDLLWFSLPIGEPSWGTTRGSAWRVMPAPPWPTCTH